jgi:hypothetical protein
MTPIVPDSPGPSCFPLLSVAGFKNFNDLVLIPLRLARATRARALIGEPPATYAVGQAT